MAKNAEYFIILSLGNLSAINPEGENIIIKGIRIKAFTIEVKIICSCPS